MIIKLSKQMATRFGKNASNQIPELLYQYKPVGTSKKIMARKVLILVSETGL
jgi:hypothetical protein